jgi:hypothetical protein
MENGAIHVWNVNSLSAHSMTAYKCVSHDHTTQTNGGNDIVCFQTLKGDNTRVISCEGWDFLGDFFHIEDGGANACIIEDCDIYWVKYTDGAGNYDVNGEYQGGEGAIDVKNCNPDTTSSFKAYGNRIWGFRDLDDVLHPSSGSSPPLSKSNGTADAYNIDYRWNIMMDCWDGVMDLRDYDTINQNHSIVRNIIYGCKTGSDKPVFYVPCENTEVYLNTTSACLGSFSIDSYWFNNNTGGTNDSSDMDTFDCMGNFIHDAGRVLNESLWGTNWKYGYNAYAGTYELSNQGYAASDYEAVSKAALNMGDFTFIRKKLTGPEEYTIPGIVPTTSTPSAFRTLVPTTGGTGNDQIGSRTGIGVDDLF